MPDLGGIKRSSRIFIVDDDPQSTAFLVRLLRHDGYENVESTTSSAEALRILGGAMPDLVILDLHMPFPNGNVILEHLKRSVPEKGFVPVLMLTGDTSPEAKHHALTLGANDFLNKPFDVYEAQTRIWNLLHTRCLHTRLELENQRLDALVRERTAQVEEAHLEVLDRLARAAELRDDDTGQHTHRVGVLSARIARAIGLSDAVADRIALAAPLHDIGKIGIPDAILLKPGPLDPDERETMKTHTTLGANMLSGGCSPLVQLAEEIARAHHERWDGNGYPAGLAGTAIPLSARIVSVADVYDALSHPRSYRGAWAKERVLETIQEGSGTHFDPVVATALLQLEGELSAGSFEGGRAPAAGEQPAGVAN